MRTRTITRRRCDSQHKAQRNEPDEFALRRGMQARFRSVPNGGKIKEDHRDGKRKEVVLAEAVVLSAHQHGVAECLEIMRYDLNSEAAVIALAPPLSATRHGARKSATAAPKISCTV